MTVPERYSFRGVTPDDLALLREWQSRPHVRQWWDSPLTADELLDTRVRRFIVSMEQSPFAYMQDYTVHGWGEHHFSDLPKGSRGIDQFIGEPQFVGKGHGPLFIAQRLTVLFGKGAPVVATDPHPDNAAAISAYRKAGFSVFGEPEDTPWGRILPMRALPP